jgi:hypothetical protein
MAEPPLEEKRGSGRCGRCGSSRIRRARTPEGWPQHIRRWTPLRRYACGTCGHRGWTLARLGTHPPSDQRVSTTRPVEARDLRRKYAQRRKILRVILLAAGLGAAAGYAILRQAAE